MESASSKRILIIDDNEAVLRMLEKWFKEYHYQIFCAQDGLTGLSLVRQLKPDCVILDLMLPGMDGHRVCRMIKFDKRLHHIPVLILTSRMGPEEEALAKQCGADAFINKGTKIERIVNEVRKLMGEEPQPPS